MKQKYSELTVSLTPEEISYLKEICQFYLDNDFDGDDDTDEISEFLNAATLFAEDMITHIERVQYG